MQKTFKTTLLMLAMLLTLVILPTQVLADTETTDFVVSGGTYTETADTLTITGAGTYTIKMATGITSTSDKIAIGDIEGDVTLNFDDVNISIVGNNYEELTADLLAIDASDYKGDLTIKGELDINISGFTVADEKIYAISAGGILNIDDAKLNINIENIELEPTTYTNININDDNYTDANITAIRTAETFEITNSNVNIDIDIDTHNAIKGSNILGIFAKNTKAATNKTTEYTSTIENSNLIMNFNIDNNDTIRSDIFGIYSVSSLEIIDSTLNTDTNSTNNGTISTTGISINVRINAAALVTTIDNSDISIAADIKKGHLTALMPQEH